MQEDRDRQEEEPRHGHIGAGNDEEPDDGLDEMPFVELTQAGNKQTEGGCQY